MLEPESSASVALEEVAEPTTEESPTSPEGSSAVKEGEPKPTGETPAAEAKPSQDKTPSPDDSEEKDPPKGKDVPYGQYMRIKEDRNKLRTLRDDLAGLGIKSKEDAEFLLKDDVERVREESHLRGRTELTDWIIEDPGRFLCDLQSKHSKAADLLDRAIAPRILERVAASQKQANPELAEQLAQLAEQYRGDGTERGHRAPESSENDAIKREKLSVQNERQETFDEQVETEVSTGFHSKVNELTKGLAFSSDKQRNRFFENVFDSASEALDNNRIFMRQLDGLKNIHGLSKQDVQERRKQVVALHLKYATDPADLKKWIEEEKNILGLTLLPKSSKTEVRGEVNGSGAPPAGKLTQDAKDRKYAELQTKYDGRLLSMKYAEWLHSKDSPGA